MHRGELVKLERLLQACTAVLAALGTALLGMGEQTAVLPLAAAAASLASFVLTDRLGVLRPPRRLTNLAMLGALFLVASEVFRYQGTRQVLVVANFLVYLQIILQFQKKDVRMYRYLLVISLFQVVSAGAYYQSFPFVFLLTIYLAIGLATLVLLTLYEQALQSPRSAAAGEAPSGRDVQGAEAMFLSQPAEPAAPAARRGLVELNRALLLRMVLPAGGTVAFAVLLFVAVPRLSGGAWQGAAGRIARGIGFSDQMRLGEVGSLLEDPSPVMRVQLEDAFTGDPVSAGGAIYLRGASFARYADKRWLDPFYPWSPAMTALPPLRPQPGRRFVRQRITLEPIETPELFGIWPYGPAAGGEFTYDPVQTRLFRLSGGSEQRTTYALFTTAFSGETLADWAPAPEPVHTPLYLQVPEDLPPEERNRRLELRGLPHGFWASQRPPSPPPPPPGGWDRLRRLADDWAAEFAGGSPESLADHYRLALFFHRNLVSSGTFRYSLESPPRNPVLDPIVDFLTDHREGHCEYFATALALLLRCRGVPTRVVIGFKCDDYNPLGDFYQVRQQDAHAWVEVYLAPDKIPERFRGEAPAEWFANGIWLRLDPTPPDRDAMSAARNPWNRFSQTFHWLDFVWLKYVVQMDRPRQREAVYQPAVAKSRQLWQTIWDRTLGREDVAARWQAVRAFLASPAGRAAAASAATAAALVALGLWLLWRSPLRRAKLLRRLGVRSGYLISPKRLGLEFYHEFEKMLAAHGRRRPPDRTPRRFMEEVAAAVLAHPDTADLHTELLESGDRIVELYYRGRYAGRLPGPEETALALDALDRWQAALRRAVSPSRR
ncbi:MAG: DUF3488 domain-containing transglutaminase family protein [Thermogutta sp.]|nr:DUF3488 domain-containing transglutaminase family protein [Thermogutta sp.]